MTRLAAILLILLAACSPTPVTTTTTITPSFSLDDPPQIPVGMDNPANRNCLTLGGTLTVKTGSAGQLALCTLPGGAVVDSTTLFHETRPNP